MIARLLSLTLCTALISEPVAGSQERASTAPQSPQQETTPDLTAQRIKGDTFALRLLRQAAAQSPDRNLLLSPASVANLLRMLADGATPEAQGAILGLLGDPPKPLADPVAQIDDPNVTIERASAVWSDVGSPPYPAYDYSVTQRFGATVQTLNLSLPAALERINTWVAEATEGKITNLIDQLPRGTSLVVTDALYFKGKWTYPFDPDATADRPFHLASGETIQVPTMELEEAQARYREDETFRALELPYGNGRYRMVAILPRKSLDTGTLEELGNATPEWFLGEGFVKAKGRLRMPRITLNHQSELLDVVRALGLEQALANPSNFAGIASPSPRIGRVVQKTLLAVDEVGSEAAAATAAIGTRSFTKVTKFELSLDRPFILAIRDDLTGELLFAGLVADPRP